MFQAIKRVSLFIFSVLFTLNISAVAYTEINIDKVTIAEMAAAYGMESMAELTNDTLTRNILKHYASAGVASSGIYWTKMHDRKAMQNAGWFTSEENYYYKRIYGLVLDKIIPKTLDVGYLMMQHPERAYYWGPYLMKICSQTKSLCMDFETVVSNGKLSFKDIQFLTIFGEVRRC